MPVGSSPGYSYDRIVRFGTDLWRSSPNPLPRQGHPEKVTHMAEQSKQCTSAIGWKGNIHVLLL